MTETIVLTEKIYKLGLLKGRHDLLKCAKFVELERLQS